MLDLHKLNQFLVLAKTGSYVRAASRLRLSQSALTRNIQSLERQYQVTLVERHRGRSGIVLTEAGRSLLRYAQDVLSRAEEVERELRGGTLSAWNPLSFGLGPMLASVLLNDVLQHHVERSDGPPVNVVIQSPAVMTERLLVGELEFYLGQESVPRASTPRIRQELLGTATPRMWVRPDHPLIGRTDLGAAALGDYRLASGEAWNTTVVPLVEDDALREALRARIQVDNYEILVSLVLGSDAVLVSAFGDRQERLVELRLSGGTALPTSYLYVFSLSGIEPSPEAARTRSRLQQRYLRLTS